MERELSARLDGAGDPEVDEALERHLATCPRCRRFELGARRLRELSRLQAADDVPDLVPEIMRRVREEGRGPRRLPAGLPRVAAVFIAAAVSGALLAGGLPGLRRSPSVLATEVPRRVAEASTAIDAYHATFQVTERNFHPRVPLRRFEASVDFQAPERLVVRVRDRTAYPSDGWPRNDLLLAVDADRWYSSGPATCPREALPACPIGPRRELSVRGREPFDGDAPLPTDIVVPVRTLAGSERVSVTGERTVAGREAVDVALAYRDAGPLFAFLQTSGAWRPFFPLDRVVVSLDRETWFPLAYEVHPARSAERRAWAARNGLPAEPAGDPIFRAVSRGFAPRVQAGFSPPVRSADMERDEGFRDRGFGGVRRAAGYEPVVPSDLRGLVPHRAGTFVSPERPEDEVLLSFTKGLSWLKVRQTQSWSGRSLFGDVGPLAAPRALPGGGVGYYEPATERLGRRLALRAPGLDVYLETNLPLPDLLAIAGSLPIRGRPIPDAWLVHRWPGGVVRRQVPLEQAVRAVPALLLPEDLPPDYRRWSIHVIETGDTVGATTYFRRPGSELDGVGLVLHQAPGQGIPPPLEPDVLSVRVRGATGRYSPTRGELEWVEDGVYRSIRATGLDLATVLRVAESLLPAEVSP